MSNTAAFILILDSNSFSKLETYSPELFASRDDFGNFLPNGLADASLKIINNPMGFDLFILRFNANEIDSSNFMKWVGSMQTIGKDVNAYFGYLTQYDYQQEIRWIENEILSKILLEDIKAIKQIYFELTLI